MAYQVAIIKRQSAILEQIVAVRDLIDNNKISLVDLNKTVDKIEDDFQAVQKLWSKWEMKLVEDDSEDFAKIADDCWYKFQSKFRQYMHRLDEHKALLAEANTTSAGAILPSPIKLPQIKLLSFNGDPFQWVNFWQSFKVHIHYNPSIPNVSKYQYLADNLSGHPRKIIDNFRATSDGYEGAIAALLDLYANPNQQRNIAFDKLLELKSPQANYTSILDFRIEVEGLCNQLTELKVDKEHPIISRIIQNRIPEDLMQKIYKETQLYPSLQDLMHGLKIILERNDFGKGQVDLVKKGTLDEGIPATTATTTAEKPYSDKTEKPAVTTSRTRGCVFCGGGHDTWRCTQYTDLPSKRTQLSKLGRCPNCCRWSHAGQCVQLAPCYQCQQDHHTWLHVDPEVSKVHINTLGVGENTPTALPTALVSLLNKPNRKSQGKHIKIRALLDQCSQRTFISQRAADQLKLRPVTQVKLDISDFLVTKSGQLCDVVRPTVKMGSRYRKIDAVVRKELNKPIITPGLKATADKLRNLGVKLADSYKDDTVSDISLLIGADHYDKFVNGSRKVQDLRLLRTPGGCIVTGPLKVPNLKKVDVLSVSVCKLGTQTPLDESQTHRPWELVNLSRGLQVSPTHSNNPVSSYENGKQCRVRQPFKTEGPDVPSNCRTALAQLNPVRKFGNTPGNLVQYDKFSHKNMDLGVRGGGLYLSKRNPSSKAFLRIGRNKEQKLQN